MKKLIALAFLFTVNLTIYAQDQEGEKPYVVKNDKIYQGDTEVTETLSQEKRNEIFTTYAAEAKLLEEKKQAEIAKEKAEKEKADVISHQEGESDNPIAGAVAS